MSASARGTASDYSKGPALLRADSARPRLLLAVLALVGALLLFAADLSTLYTVVVGALQSPRRTVSAGSNHGYALTLVAAVAIAMALAWLRGMQVAGPLIALLGATALVVVLAVDLPDTRTSGRLPEARAYSEVRARAGRALALELAGGVVLVAGGLGMLVAGRRLSPTGRPSRPDAPPT